MHLFAQTVILGLITGLIYALTGAGLVAVYRTSRIINFAQGSIGTVGLYCAYPLTRGGHPYWLIAVVVLVTASVAGLLVGLIVTLVGSRRDELIAGLSAIGISLLIDGLITIIEGGGTRAFPSLGTERVFTLAGVAITRADVGIAVVAAVAFLLLGLMFSRTTTGLGMRAISENARAAQTIGVRSTQLRLASWLIGGLLAGIAALFLAPLLALTPTSIEGEMVYGFAAVVVGGFDSILGSLVAGVGLGIVSNIIGLYWDLNLVTTGLFVVMVALLVLRPYGLFGRRPLERV